MVDLVEHTAEGIHMLGGRASGRGSIAFTAVPGHGSRQHLRVTRSGAKATITVSAVRGARSHNIYVVFDPGERRLYSTTARRRKLGGISAGVTALVTVQAMRQGLHARRRSHQTAIVPT